MPDIENGLVRLVWCDASDVVLATIFEERTEKLGKSAVFSEQVPMPKTYYRGFEDSKLKLMFKPDATDNVVKANSDIELSITKWTVRNGKPVSTFPSTLTEVDLINHDAGAGVQCVAGVWTELGSVEVPAGQAYEVGVGLDGSLHGAVGRFYCKLMDDTI